MTFINPVFLWFIPIAAAPVIIHLLNRSKRKRVMFSTLKFLQAATKRTLKRFQFLQLLLLLVRVLIVMLLTLAFSRPVWQGYTGEKEVLYNVILIDNSYSMQYRMGREDALALSRELSLQLVRELDGQFSVGVMNRGLEELSEFTDDRRSVFENIDKIRISPYETDIRKSLNDAAKMIRSRLSRDIPVNMIILSDLNRDAFGGSQDLRGAENMKFLLIDTCDGDDNAWISNAKNEPAYKDIPCRITVEAASVKTSDTRMSFFVGDTVRDRKSLRIDRVCSAEFGYTFKQAGTFACRLELEENPSSNRISADDAYYFHIEVRPRIRILIVDGDPGYTHMEGESYFVTRALSPASYSTPVVQRVINPEELGSIDERDYDELFLLNVNLDHAINSRVIRFSEHGKGIGIFLGDNTEYDIYNELFSSLLPVRIVSSSPADTSAGKVRLSEGCGDMFSEDAFLTVGKAVNTVGEPGEKPCVFAGETPLVWLYSPRLVKRRVALFTSTVDMDWNNFPVRPSYPVFIQKISAFLCRSDSADHGRVEAGYALSEDETAAGISSEFPLSEGTGGPRLRYPGNYTVIKGDEKKYYSVNLVTETGEPGLERAGPQEIKKIFSEEEIHFLPYSENLKQDIIKTITGEEKSHLFLFTGFILLAAEEFLRKYIRIHED
ncbi:MAG: BatA and WFA domain-containing protein [Elusimicrobia bacterium]|nr:BatA and WFA domain-containing protein [Elusimicrobiota bacterium]